MIDKESASVPHGCSISSVRKFHMIAPIWAGKIFCQCKCAGSIEKYFSVSDIRGMPRNPILWWQREAGLTERQLAELVELAPSTIRYLLRPQGRAGRLRGGEWQRIKPSRETLQKINDLTGLPLPELIAYFGVGARGRKKTIKGKPANAARKTTQNSAD